MFGQATYRGTDSIEVTAGLRYGENRKNAVQASEVRSGLTNQPVPEPVPGLFQLLPTETMPHRLQTSAENKRLLPQVSARWQIMPALSLYARYAKGSQDGGINLFYGGSDPTLAAFKPESSDDYEAGIKAQTADRRATLNINVYDVEFQNLQTTQFTGSTSYVVANAGDPPSPGRAASRWKRG